MIDKCTVIVHGLRPLSRVKISAGTFDAGNHLMARFDYSIGNVTTSAFDISETKVTIGAYEEYLQAIRGHRITMAVTDPKTGNITIVGRGRTEAAVRDAYEKSLSSRMSPGGRIEQGGRMIFEVTTPRIPQKFCQYQTQPVVKIDWWEMLAFAAAHGGDLPTDAEYLRVKKGKSGKDEYIADPAPAHSDRTWRVKAHPANSWGVFDASGNVWTWTKTWYPIAYHFCVKDPQGPKHGTERVVRGGSCFIEEEDSHIARRNVRSPAERHKDLGGVVVWRSSPNLSKQAL